MPSTPGTGAKRSAEDLQDSQRNIRRKMDEAPRIGKSIITVLVGTGQQAETYYVYEHILTQHSDFFQAALRPGWPEAEKRHVDLSEESAVLFEIFLHFITSGQIFSQRESSYSCLEEPGAIVWDDEWTRLRDAWLLGQVLQSTSFKDAVTDAVRAKEELESQSPLQLQDSVYASSSASSGLRRLLVDFAASRRNAKEFQESETDQPAEFFYDVLLALKRAGPMADTGQSGVCAYHEHDEGGKICYLTMF